MLNAWAGRASLVRIALFVKPDKVGNILFVVFGEHFTMGGRGSGLGVQFSDYVCIFKTDLCVILEALCSITDDPLYCLLF